MQHLRAEVGQLRRFRERDDLDAMPDWKHSRIAREHAIHVGPDLNLAGADAGPGDGGREVRPAASQRDVTPFAVADKSAHHHHGGPCASIGARACSRAYVSGYSGLACVWRVVGNDQFRASTWTAGVPRCRKRRRGPGSTVARHRRRWRRPSGGVHRGRRG
jgi:hypothetical protein